MQGISNSKHRHLVDALLQLENLLGRDFEHDADKQQAAEYRMELDLMLVDYERLLSDLAELIGHYNALSGKARLQFLSPKLKELRRQLPQDKPAFRLLARNIQLVYGS